MNTSDPGRGGPGDHNYFGPPHSRDDPPCPPDDEQPSQLNQDVQPLQLTVAKRRGQDDEDGGKKPRYYRVHIEDWRTATTNYRNNLPDEERLSTSFANPAASFANPATSFVNPATSFANPATSFVNPATSFANPATSFANPATSFVNPATSFANPATSFANPAKSFVNPATSFANPATSFANPATSFVNPATSFVNPATSFANPATSFANPATSFLNPATSFANPATRYRRPNATYPNPEPIYIVSENVEPIASTSAGPSYMTVGSVGPVIESIEVLPEYREPCERRKEYPGSKTSMFKTRWLRRRLEETLPLQNTVFQPIPSTSQESISPGPQSNTVNVSTQVELGELGNITYEDQIEEQIESLRCSLCQATNYCRKKCSMRGKRAHGMWCLHGIMIGNEGVGSRLPEPETPDTSYLTVDQNRNLDRFENDAIVTTSQDYSAPGMSSEVAHYSGSHHMPMLYDDPPE